MREQGILAHFFNAGPDTIAIGGAVLVGEYVKCIRTTFNEIVEAQDEIVQGKLSGKSTFLQATFTDPRTLFKKTVKSKDDSGSINLQPYIRIQDEPRHPEHAH